MIFETHAHYDDERFDEDRDGLLAKLPQAGISRVINIGSSIEATRQTVEIARRYDYVYAAVGVHPSDIGDLDEEAFAWLQEQTLWEKTVAVGEIGLDYYWDKDPAVQEKQRYWFGRQLDLAKRAGLPVVIHSREAAADTMQVMKMHNAEDILGVVHCYSYSKELALDFIQMGYYIGVGGVLTFKNSRKLAETVKAIPMERILLETDSPYLAPEPHRGKRNTSLNIPYVVAKIAEIRGITEEEVERITEENAYRLFTKVR